MGAGASRRHHHHHHHDGGNGHGAGSMEEADLDSEARDGVVPVKRWVNDHETFPDENSLLYSRNPTFAELRKVLADPLGQVYLGRFAKAENSHENLFAWVDMEEFRAVPTEDYRRSIARQIFQKYLKRGAIMQLGGLRPESIDTIGFAIYGPQYARLPSCGHPSAMAQRLHSSGGGGTMSGISSEASSEASEAPGDNVSAEAAAAAAAEREKAQQRHEMTPKFFVGMQHMAFRAMAENTFERFRASKEYEQYMELRRRSYNTVDVGDFDYINFLGQGAFGFVARVRKTSTGRLYAMKVMNKAKLVRDLGHGSTSERRRERICIERDVYANARFPFLVEMHYAFHTEQEAVIVMELAQGGTLRDLIREAPGGRLPEDQARFLTAELALALRNLHCMNYVHRDLKPANVLLDAQGHVKLADMGLVARIDDTRAVGQAPDRRTLVGGGAGDNDDDGEGKDAGASASDVESEVETDDDDDDDDEPHNDEPFSTGHSSGASSAEDREKRPSFVGRRFTRVGTVGYKAPELLLARRPRRRRTSSSASAGSAVLPSPSHDERVRAVAAGGGMRARPPAAYGASVDWWALGIVVMEMLCGRNYFVPRGRFAGNGDKDDPESLELHVIESLARPSELVPSTLSAPGKEFVDGLLHKEPLERLGVGSEGFRRLRNHAWFASLDINKLLDRSYTPPHVKARQAAAAAPEQKQTNAEFIEAELATQLMGGAGTGAGEDVAAALRSRAAAAAPTSPSNNSKAKKTGWASYAAMKAEVEALDLSLLMGERPEPARLADRHQRFFGGWDFVAPQTLQLELGAQEKRLTSGILPPMVAVRERSEGKGDS